VDQPIVDLSLCQWFKSGLNWFKQSGKTPKFYPKPTLSSPFYSNSYFWLFIVGNSSTSRIAWLSVSSIVMRSMPKPMPPVKNALEGRFWKVCALRRVSASAPLSPVSTTLNQNWFKNGLRWFKPASLIFRPKRLPEHRIPTFSGLL